jgi:hypothetical protein
MSAFYLRILPGGTSGHFRKALPVQVVDATPSELEALPTGGVYESKKTNTAFGDAES